jgi:anaerobic magnesium-protoporphyrin IX monomethyl ester cyclase
MDGIVRYIEDFSPNIIGYSVTTPNYSASIELCRVIKDKFPQIPSVMGGYHPSVCPEQTLSCESVDFVIRNEGEHSLLALCEALNGRSKNFSNIPNLSYKTTVGQNHNEKALNVNVNELPFPAYDLLPMHMYSSPSYTKFASPVYQMLASRGCPYSCKYCINAGSNVAARYRRRHIASVLDEIEHLVSKYNAKQIQFWDPIFPLGKKHAHEFCQELRNRGLHRKIVWSSTTRAELLDQETIEAMAHSGCKGVGFGIESGVPELLKSVNKKFKFDKIRATCRIARKNGLVVSAGFIIGFPGETKKMTQQTIDFAKSLDLHYAQFSIMTPYPGTPLYKELVSVGEISGILEDDHIRYNQSVGLTDLDPIYVPIGRDASELKRMHKQAYIQFYFRPRMIWMHLQHLRFANVFWYIKSLRAIIPLLFKNLLNFQR